MRRRDRALLFRFPFNVSLQFSSRFHIILKKTFDLREQENYSLQGIIGVFEYSGPLTRFFRSKLVPCKHSVRVCENFLESHKTGMVPPINFYKTRTKDPVIITRIRSSSNVLIFLVSC